jgi:1,6-anhydro-N-acetylmuramate kinase
MADTDSNPPRERIVAGCMTGTSLDGLDAALVRIVGTGLDMTAEYLGWVSHPMDPGLRDTLMHLASGGAAEPLTYLRAARGMGELYADGVQHLLDETKGPRPAFVVAHGQTIWHAPRDPRQDDAGSPIPGGGPKSWQLFDPWPVVRRHGIPVCYDLRQADLIAGGEGAPLTPIADWVMYREKAAIVFNLGGVGNYTSLIEGFDLLHAGDICPCNLLLDGLSQRLLGEPYDKDGACASQGKRVQDVLLAINRAVLKARRDHGHPHSIGREQFNPRWLDRLVETIKPMASVEDILRSAVINTAIDLCAPMDELDESDDWDEGHRHTIVVAGGGAKNRTLIEQMRVELSVDPEDDNTWRPYRYDVVLSDDLGIPCEAREAMGFAVLGALSQDGVPCSLPQVTGAKDPGVAGVWAGPGPR